MAAKHQSKTAKLPSATKTVKHRVQLVCRFWPTTPTSHEPWPRPLADSPYNVFELGRMFAALCDLLTHAGLCMNGLFLNADKPFDTHELRRACADCGIAANIARNRWTTDWQTDDNTTLDPELYRHRLVIEQMNT